MSETPERKSYSSPESPRVVASMDVALNSTGSYGDSGSGYSST